MSSEHFFPVSHCIFFVFPSFSVSAQYRQRRTTAIANILPQSARITLNQYFFRIQRCQKSASTHIIPPLTFLTVYFHAPDSELSATGTTDIFCQPLSDTFRVVLVAADQFTGGLLVKTNHAYLCGIYFIGFCGDGGPDNGAAFFEVELFLLRLFYGG